MSAHKNASRGGWRISTLKGKIQEMEKLARVLSAIDAISKWSGFATMFLVIVLALLMSIEAVSRYVFNAPIVWTTETTGLVFGVYVLLAGAYVLLLGGHVSADVLYSRLSLRQKAILDVLTSVFFFIFCGMLLWKGIPTAIKSVVLYEHSQSAWGAPYWPTRVAIPVGAFLILLQGLAKLIRDFHVALTGRKLA